MRSNSPFMTQRHLLAFVSSFLLAITARPVFADATPPAAVLTIQAMAKMESEAIQELQEQAERERKPIRRQPMLLAIVGVVPELKASVLVDGAPVLFQQGQAKPLDGLESKRRLRLRQIKPPCVSFFDNGQPRRVCLHPENS